VVRERDTIKGHTTKCTGRYRYGPYGGISVLYFDTPGPAEDVVVQELRRYLKPFSPGIFKAPTLEPMSCRNIKDAMTRIDGVFDVFFGLKY
jgi:hypothetical protein